ncbi:MAG: hypothetical protein NXH95_01265 [Pseudomonadaceae bacterium]|nr:hypothetical protein [Pseudomonadaceae bacterium]
MAKRGPKSQAELQVARLADFKKLPEPPGDLTEVQAALWHQIVATKPTDWWDGGNLPLLRALVIHETSAQLIDRAIERFPDAELYTDDGLTRYHRLSKVRADHTTRIESLSTKMRLSQQSKYGARQAETATRAKPASRTWGPADEH